MMCDHSPNREAAMVIVKPDVWCDPCLVPLIRALNDGGIATVASCCGHGRNVGSICLTDGRVLAILPNLNALSITIAAISMKAPRTDGVPHDTETNERGEW